MSPFYFAYGSNMSSSRLIQRVGAVEICGVATLRNYRHLFNKHGADGTAKGNIEEAIGARVMGALYRLSIEQFDVLKGYEGGYRASLLEVEVSGQTFQARAFIGERLHAGDLVPKAEYLEHYRAGLSEHGLPDDYVREILGRFS